MTRNGLLTALAVSFIFAGSAHASLIMTPTGIADGFTLSTFATINPGNTGCCLGPFGVAMASNGNVIVATGQTVGIGQRYVFPDIDGQTPATALFQNYFFPTSVGAFANAGGKPYANDFTNGSFLALNDDGSVNHTLTGVTPRATLGMWGNPVNGHIIAQSSLGLLDIDPLANGGAGSFTLINPSQGDGLTVSNDGQIVYSVQFGVIKGYKISDGTLVYTSQAIPGDPDGIGIISSTNAYNGDFLVNTNSGSVYLLDPIANSLVEIATGGARGDYVSPDLSNGTLFLDFADVVARIGCGANCSIGSSITITSAPEPADLVLSATGLLLMGLGLLARRRAL